MRAQLIEDRDVDLLVGRERNLARHFDQRRLEDAVTEIERVGPDEESEVRIAHGTSLGASRHRFGRNIGAGDSSMPHMSSPDPSRIVDVLCAYWQTAALIGRDRSWRVHGSRRPRAERLGTGRACRADRASLIRLCDFLVSLGLLRSANGRYRAAADAARFLDAQSPESLAAIRRFFSAPPVSTALAALSATVCGGPKVDRGVKPHRGRRSRRRRWRCAAARRRRSRRCWSARARRRPHPRCRRGRIAPRDRAAAAMARRHAGGAGSRSGGEDWPGNTRKPPVSARGSQPSPGM